jgi:hypothetical protein
MTKINANTMKKLRIEGYSCTEEGIFDALCEAKILITALQIEWIEIKVFKDSNRQEKEGHSWIKVSKDSSVHDLMNIYRLQEQVKKLENNGNEIS